MMDPVSATEVIDFLKANDAYWQWDGHKHVAELTSGKISDFFANCTPIYTDPKFNSRVGKHMANALISYDIRNYLERSNKWVVGSAMGAIGLALPLASNIQAKAAYTEQADGKAMNLKRFDLGQAPCVFLVEDVITTGGTTSRTVDAILDKHPDAIICPVVSAVINRSGSTEGFVKEDDSGRTLSFVYAGLVEVEPKVWNDVGEMPEHMRRCVPIRPKGNWDKLVNDFSL